MLITLCNVSYMNFYEVISVTTTKTLSRHLKFIVAEANCVFAWFTRAYGSIFGKVCAKDYGQMDGWAGFQTDLWMRDRAFY